MKAMRGRPSKATSKQLPKVGGKRRKVKATISKPSVTLAKITSQEARNIKLKKRALHMSRKTDGRRAEQDLCLV